MIIMLSKVSSWGIIAVVIFLIATASLFLYATSCTETFCGLIALLAGMPWLLFLDFVGGDSYNSGIFGWVAIGLNVVILYFIFAVLQNRRQK